MSDNPSKQDPPVYLPRLRWWPAAVLAVFGVGMQLWIWNGWNPDRTIQVFGSYIWGALCILLLGVWWLLFSGISWRERGLGVLVVAVLTAIFALLVRVDDVTGEVFPVLAWRWSPRRADLVKQYLHEQRQQARVDRNAAAGAAQKNETADVPVEAGKPVSGSNQVPEKPSDIKLTASDWPEYRGANRDGIVRETQIRTDWDAHPPVALWRHPMGPGWSSFAIVNGQAFTQEQRADDQDRDAEAVVCYDALTGKQIWEHLDLGKFTHALGGEGPRATPTWHQGRLYTYGAAGVLNCLDASTGKLIWSHHVLQDNQIQNAEYGMTGSPLVHEQYVVIQPGGPEGHSLMAFDRLTGKLLWQSGNNKAAYASPQLSEVDGVMQLLVFDAAGVGGYELETGKQLWSFPWTNGAGINAAQPIVFGRDQVFVSTSYGIGSVMLRVKQSASGWTAEELWQTRQIRFKFNCGVLKENYLYGLDEGILTCFDLRDGTKKWKGGRYRFGQVLLVDDKLLILSETGEVVLVDANPNEFREITRFQAIDGKTWNNPALWKGLLFVRNSNEAACYDLRTQAH